MVHAILSSPESCIADTLQIIGRSWSWQWTWLLLSLVTAWRPLLQDYQADWIISVTPILFHVLQLTELLYPFRRATYLELVLSLWLCHCRSKLSIILTFYFWWLKNSIGALYSYFIGFNYTGWVWLTAVTHLCTAEVALWTASKIFVQGISRLYFHLSLSWSGPYSLNPWLPRLLDPLSITAMLGSFSFRTCLVSRMSAWPFWIVADRAENFVWADDAHLLDWEYIRLDYLARLGCASYVIDNQEKHWNCRHHVDLLC